MKCVRLAAMMTLTGAAAGCLDSPPPPELQGLWSGGPAACAAQMGVRFLSDEVTAAFDDGRTQALLHDPEYAVERRGARLRVRISYALPAPDDAPELAARGALTLERDSDGWLNVADHRLQDARTGAVRLILNDDPAARAFRLRRCGPDAWIEGLRGTTDA